MRRQIFDSNDMSRGGWLHSHGVALVTPKKEEKN